MTQAEGAGSEKKEGGAGGGRDAPSRRGRSDVGSFMSLYGAKTTTFTEAVSLGAVLWRHVTYVPKPDAVNPMSCTEMWGGIASRDGRACARGCCEAGGERKSRAALASFATLVPSMVRWTRSSSCTPWSVTHGTGGERQDLTQTCIIVSVALPHTEEAAP